MNKIILITFLLVLGGRHCLAQNPAWSANWKTISGNVASSLTKAESALKAEGYTVAGKGEGWMGAYKGNHTAIIIAHAEAGGKIFITVTVASNVIEGKIPEGEASRIFSRLGDALPASSSSASGKGRKSKG